MWTVYIIKSENKKWYYVGSINDLNRRFGEHNSGNVKSTNPYKPFKIVYKKSFSTEKQARNYEHKIKNRRIEKERIIKEIENYSGIV